MQIDPKKRARIVELAKTGLYSKAEIERLILKKFGSVNQITLDRILKEEKITVPKGFIKSASKQSADRSLYLKDYNFEDLETDIKAGKTRTEIAEELFNKNPEYYNKLKTSRGVKTSIATAIGKITLIS